MSMTIQQLLDKVPGLQQTLDRCQDELQKLINCDVTVYFRIKMNRLTSNHLASIVCKVFDARWEEVLGSSRKTNIKLARHFFCYYAFHVLKIIPVRIAEILDVDHSTVLHAKERIKIMLEVKDELYTDAAEQIEAMINSYLSHKESTAVS